MSIYEQQRQELNQLCLAVIHEKDPNQLTKLIAALNVLLARTEGGAKPGANKADAA
jgi:hypothetical protein